MSSCTESDPRFIQLCLAISSGLIWHLCWELLAFICFELAVSFVHPTRSEDTVDNLFPLHCLHATDGFSDIWHYSSVIYLFFFFRLKTFIGCLSIPFAIVVLSSFHFLLYPFRLEDTIKHSRCRHAINLHMIQSLFFSCLLCFQFSCPFLFFSSTWPFLATIEDWIGPYWNCLLQPRSSTECELRDYHFIWYALLHTSSFLSSFVCHIVWSMMSHEVLFPVFFLPLFLFTWIT